MGGNYYRFLQQYRCMPYDPNKTTIQLSAEIRQQLKLMKGKMDAQTYEEVIKYLFEETRVYLGQFVYPPNQWFILIGTDRDNIGDLFPSHFGIILTIH